MMAAIARNGHAAMSDLSPLSGVKRKSDFGAVRAAFDPERTPKSSDSVCEITIRAGQTDPGALPGLI